MKFTGVIVANLGVPDQFGEMFAEDCQFTFGDVIPVTDAGAPGSLENNFGEARLRRLDNKIIADLEIFDATPLSALIKTAAAKDLPVKFYPALNGWTKVREGSVLKDCRINSIDISLAGNSDETIQPLTLTKEIT